MSSSSSNHNHAVLSTQSFIEFTSFDSAIQSRLATLRDFEPTESPARPSFVVRAPGRVNLLGEHVDYSGFGVMPMAVASDVSVRVSFPTSGGLTFDNVEARFEEKVYGTLEAEQLAVDLDNHHWSHYVLCGYKAAFDAFAKKGLAPPSLKPLRLTVYGNVPAGSGLSSSSALVVASTLAVAAAYDIPVTRTEVAVAAIEGERHVGTMSGGMDQSASILGQAGKGLYIQFVPSLTASPVTLPPGVTFVICNCLKKKEKAVDASQYYNKRVVECRLAALLLAKANSVPLAGVKTLRDVLDALASGPEEYQERMTSLASYCASQSASSPTLTLPAVAEILGKPAASDILPSYFSDRAEQVKDVFEDSDTFVVWDRARHVFEESLRVMSASAADLVGEGFGKVMCDSHASCRDLFGCSCPELDALVSASMESGALGSRLTGAGWGGCNVSAVRDGDVEGFIAEVKEKYYKAFLGMDDVPDNAICVSNGSVGAGKIAF